MILTRLAFLELVRLSCVATATGSSQRRRTLLPLFAATAASAFLSAPGSSSSSPSSSSTASFLGTASAQTTGVASRSTSSSSCSASTTTALSSSMVYPDLCVFDLDACFWDQEMYEMPELPSRTVRGDLNGRGEGAAGVFSGPHKISLHGGSLAALQDHADGRHGAMKVCFASSADTPLAERIGRAALQALEVLPGLTVWDLVVGRDWNGTDVNQIGRQPPLSSNKAASHFPRIKQLTGIRYDKMLFFDDCNWGDHCGMVAAGCRESDTKVGPAVVRTPYGLGVKEWNEGLRVYAEQAAALEAKQRR